MWKRRGCRINFRGRSVGLDRGRFRICGLGIEEN